MPLPPSFSSDTTNDSLNDLQRPVGISSSGPPIDCTSSSDQAESRPTVVTAIGQLHANEQTNQSPRGALLTGSSSEYFSAEEVKSLLSEMESKIRSELNIQILNLQDQITNLSHRVQSMPSHASLVSGTLNHPDTVLPTRGLAHLVVWGTDSSCNAEVVTKAITALLAPHLSRSITVNKSVKRLRNSKRLWWFTVFAPPEIMTQIETFWPSLESRSSWSLQPALSRHNTTIQHSVCHHYLTNHNINTPATTPSNMITSLEHSSVSVDDHSLQMSTTEDQSSLQQFPVGNCNSRQEQVTTVANQVSIQESSNPRTSCVDHDLQQQSTSQIFLDQPIDRCSTHQLETPTTPHPPEDGHVPSPTPSPEEEQVSPPSPSPAPEVEQ